MSVVASVLSVVIAMSFGISASWWTGVACYALALAAITRTTGGTSVPTRRPPRNRPLAHHHPHQRLAGPLAGRILSPTTTAPPSSNSQTA